MSQFKGKELIRRLAWLVYQDQEHYRYQLEKAVSIPLEFQSIENVLECVPHSYSLVHSRERSHPLLIFVNRVSVLKTSLQQKRPVSFWHARCGPGKSLLLNRFKAGYSRRCCPLRITIWTRG